MPGKEKGEPEEGKRGSGNEKPEPGMGHHCGDRRAAQWLGSKSEADTQFFRSHRQLLNSQSNSK